MFDDQDFENLSENPTYASISQLAGEEAALKLSKDFGGRRLHIPANPGPHSPLSVSIGLAAAQKISQVYGQMSFDVPLSQGKRARILELRKRKVPVPAIAHQVGCTERNVYKVCAAVREDSNQLSLFECG